MRIACETEILCSPEEVFTWVAEPEKAMKWQRNVKAGEIITSKPEVVGTTFKEIVEEGGKTLEMYGVITRFAENKTIGFHIVSKIHEFDISYYLEAKHKSTRMSIEAIIRWKFPINVVSLVLGKRMKKGLTRQLESELLELKRLCETERTRVI